ncbi:hypothetical protein JCM17823_19200 [Halorubrum gandharaense]
MVSLLAGCVDRIHDLSATTPGDVDVRSRSLNGDVLTESTGIAGRAASVHAASFTAAEGATDALSPDSDDYDAAAAFVDDTEFLDDGGGSVLVAAQRVTTPAVELRLGSVSRTSRESLRIAVDEIGHGGPDDEVVKTLLIRLTDRRGTVERVTVSFGGERASVTL